MRIREGGRKGAKGLFYACEPGPLSRRGIVIDDIGVYDRIE
jgi:hypothetical protein